MILFILSTLFIKFIQYKYMYLIYVNILQNQI